MEKIVRAQASQLDPIPSLTFEKELQISAYFASDFQHIFPHLLLQARVTPIFFTEIPVIFIFYFGAANNQVLIRKVPGLLSFYHIFVMENLTNTPSE